MSQDRYLYPAMALSLAIGILVGTLVAVPRGAALSVLCVCVLSLIAFALSHRGAWGLASLCLFMCLVGLLRPFLPPLSLIPEALRLDSAVLAQDLVSGLHAAGLSPTADSLVTAMLLGNREGLPSDVVQLYRQTGASHILALSGLHLGILFGVLNYWLLRVLPSRLRYVFGGLAIILIWTYALLVGLPVSLCRASAMMSLLLISETTFSGYSSWNLFGIAGMLLLLINPATLFDVGFQLSFGAIAGIFLFYVPVRNLFQPSRRFASWLWQAWAVSLSAQLFTLPLLFHYFGYFSLSGILLSPLYIFLATCIIFSALLFLLATSLGIGFLLKPLVEFFVATQHGLMSCASRFPWGGMWADRLSWASVLLISFSLLCLLPPLRSLQPCETQSPRLRLVQFLRTWPYLTASILLLAVAYVIG